MIVYVMGTNGCSPTPPQFYAQMGSTTSGPWPTEWTLKPMLRSCWASTMLLPSKRNAGFFMVP